MADVNINCYSAPWDIPGGSVNDSVNLLSSEPGVIYDIYDDLAVNCPDFVKKKVMGNVFGYDLNRYTFADPAALDPIKICVITSIHGYEQGCAWTAAHFFRLLCGGEDPQLQYLRQNVVFDVIPVANPWGFAHNDRKNGHQVDLNRNFEPYFVGGKEPSSEEYGGVSPFSETETKILVQFISENRDAELILDYHNIANGYPLFYVYGQRDVELADTVFSALTPKWCAEYPALPGGQLLGYTKPNGHFGMFADYLIDNGLWVLTMETPWRMPEIGESKYDAPTIRCAVDVLVNTLLTVTRQVKER